MIALSYYSIKLDYTMVCSKVASRNPTTKEGPTDILRPAELNETFWSGAEDGIEGLPVLPGGVVVEFAGAVAMEVILTSVVEAAKLSKMLEDMLSEAVWDSIREVLVVVTVPLVIVAAILVLVDTCVTVIIELAA